MWHIVVVILTAVQIIMYVLALGNMKGQKIKMYPSVMGKWGGVRRSISPFS